MSNIRNAVPASLRRPVESSRIVPGMGLPPQRSTMMVSGPEGRAITLTKSRFARLPQEPEDARLTGVTRSLNRRLLALNVPGSLRMSEAEDFDLVAKIA